MGNKTASIKKTSEKLLAVLETCSEDVQETFWKIARKTLQSLIDPDGSAVHLLVAKGDIQIVPINLEVEEAQDLIMWLGTRIQEHRQDDIAAAAASLKN